MILQSNAKPFEPLRKEKLYDKLDKGINDMEAGKITPHKDAMKRIRESVSAYVL